MIELAKKYIKSAIAIAVGFGAALSQAMPMLQEMLEFFQ